MSIKEKPTKKRDKPEKVSDAKPKQEIDDWLESVKPEKVITQRYQAEEKEDAIVQVDKTQAQELRFLENLPTWTSKPWMFVQPTHQTQLASWLDSWKLVVLDYARTFSYHVINITVILEQHPFKNMKNNKRLTKDSIEQIINKMIDEGLAKWLDDNHILVRIYYKTNEEWSAIILEYLTDTGLAAEVLTLYEIEKIDQEWSSLPREELVEIFDILVDQQRAMWIGNSKDTLSFIL
ncbi:MAG: hypothetical protein ACXAD7_05005 [Candidatus Kariarchaeaceae archaeon]|jgi:hypothetical protein